MGCLHAARAVRLEARAKLRELPGVQRLAHLAQHAWFAGEHLSMADFQMSFAVEAALSRTDAASHHPHLLAYRERMQQRPAYQRALAKGGPVVMGG